MKLIAAFLSVILASIPNLSFACRELSSTIIFSEGTNEQYPQETGCYVISIPEGYLGKGEKGRTTVYFTRPQRDKIAYEYDWYSKSLALSCEAGSEKVDVSMVRLNFYNFEEIPERRNVLEFYYRGKLVKAYHYRDLAPKKEDYWVTSCGARVVVEAAYKRDSEQPEKIVYRAQLRNKTIEFDLVTGEIIRQQPSGPVWMDNLKSDKQSGTSMIPADEDVQTESNSDKVFEYFTAPAPP